MDHKLYYPGDDHHCPARDDVPGSCMICDGGLAICRTCGGAEGSLPTHCPGVRMTSYAEDQVYTGRLNFREGQWHKESTAERERMQQDACRSLGTGQCAAICLSHLRTTADCPEYRIVWTSEAVRQEYRRRPTGPLSQYFS